MLPPMTPRSFAARVSFAARYIRENRTTNRAFDGCFEEGDGDEVCVALYRLARKRPAGKLAVNMPRFLGMDSVLAAVERAAESDN